MSSSCASDTPRLFIVSGKIAFLPIFKDIRIAYTFINTEVGYEVSVDVCVERWKKLSR